MEKVHQHSHKFFLSALIIAIIGLFLAQPAGAVSVGEAAPDFTGAAIDGSTVKLSELKGKMVVLEWTNPGCPFVVKHYKSGNMQALQEELTAKGVVWISINSSAEGKEGHFTADKAGEVLTEWHKGHPTAYVLDPSGEIGHLYGAKTTPHMFVIDAEGKLAYMGAIDDKDTADPEDVKTARNYVRDAVSALIEGRPVEPSATRSYGCSVKY